MSKRVQRLLLLSLAAASAVVIALVAWSVPQPDGLQPLVAARLADSGVGHPVTAVLLNFRSLDTLLEVAVLVVAVIAVAALPAAGGRAAAPARIYPLGPLVDWLLARLLIVGVLMAAYLLWAGAYQPGGAFQGGTVLGAAAVLLLLGNRLARPPQSWQWRAVVVLGLMLFLAVGVAGAVSGAGLLVYPVGWAGAAILAIELALTLSIAACFLNLVGAAYGDGEAKR